MITLFIVTVQYSKVQTTLIISSDGKILLLRKLCRMIGTILTIDSTKPPLSSLLHILGYLFSVDFDPTDKFPYNPHYYTFLLKLYRTV